MYSISLGFSAQNLSLPTPEENCTQMDSTDQMTEQTVLVLELQLHNENYKVCTS